MNTPDIATTLTCEVLIDMASNFNGSCWDAFDQYPAGVRGQMIIDCRWCVNVASCDRFRNDWVWASVFIMSYFSGVSLLVIGFYLKETSVFSKHPYPLIARSLMVQSMFYFCEFESGYACLVDYTQLFKSSFGWDEQFVKEYFVRTDQFLTFQCMQMSLLLQTLVFVDLYLTLTNPFVPRNFRNKYYVPICVIFFLIVGFLNIQTLNFEDAGSSVYQRIGQIIIVALVILVVISSLFVAIRLLKKGTSPNIRRKILLRHYLYFVFFMVIASVYYISYVDNKNPLLDMANYKDRSTFKWWIFYYFTYQLAGTFLALIRVSEPYVFWHLKRDIFMTCFCKRKLSKKSQKNRPKFSRESLCSFANSAMAVEFVYIIILGVNAFMENMSYEQEDQSADAGNEISIKRDRTTTVINFKKVQFDQISQWDVEKSRQFGSALSSSVYSK